MEIRLDSALGIITLALFVAAFGWIIISGVRSGASKDEIIDKLISTVNNIDSSSVEKIRIAGELVPPSIVDGAIKVGEVAKLVTDDKLDQLITAVEHFILKVSKPIAQPEIERIAQAIADSPVETPVGEVSLGDAIAQTPQAITLADPPVAD